MKVLTLCQVESARVSFAGCRPIINFLVSSYALTLEFMSLLLNMLASCFRTPILSQSVVVMLTAPISLLYNFVLSIVRDFFPNYSQIAHV